MAISTPGDIILDVARAVEPSALEAAREKLMSIVGKVAGDDSFADRLGADLADMRGAPVSHRLATGPTPEAFQKFEAMVLQTFLQDMLPKEAETVYGSGMAGEMWKTFLAQQLGEQMAKGGGIGIANRVLGDFYMDRDRPVAIAGLDGAPEETAKANAQSLLSTAMVQEIQRSIVRGVAQLADEGPAGVTSGR
jgi:flagellar protein FlgJ